MKHVIWKPIGGYEGRYEISNTGVVRSLGRHVVNTRYESSRYIPGQVIKPFTHSGGYLSVKLAINGKKTNYYVHRLVALAFHCIPARSSLQVRHKNGIKTDNRAENLEWGTCKDNFSDRRRLGEHVCGERHGRRKLSENQVRQIRKDTRFHKDIAADHGVSVSLISMIRRRHIWTHI